MWSAFQWSILKEVEEGSGLWFQFIANLLLYQQFLIESEVLRGKLKVLNVL